MGASALPLGWAVCRMSQQRPHRLSPCCIVGKKCLISSISAEKSDRVGGSSVGGARHANAGYLLHKSCCVNNVTISGSGVEWMRGYLGFRRRVMRTQRRWWRITGACHLFLSSSNSPSEFTDGEFVALVVVALDFALKQTTLIMGYQTIVNASPDFSKTSLSYIICQKYMDSLVK